MAKHHETGKLGERLAEDFLSNKGYEILETNWRHRRAEVDIIAKDKEILVFVEVKTRSDSYFGRPESFVTERKRTLMYEAASVYMERIGHDWEVRFDIVAVMIHNDVHQSVEHFRDAFFKGLE